VLSREVLRSAVVTFRISWKLVFHQFCVSSSLDMIPAVVLLHKFVLGLKPPFSEPAPLYEFLKLFLSILFYLTNINWTLLWSTYIVTLLYIVWRLLLQMNFYKRRREIYRRNWR
jgi:hypothetical protein